MCRVPSVGSLRPHRWWGVGRGRASVDAKDVRRAIEATIAASTDSIHPRPPVFGSLTTRGLNAEVAEGEQSKSPELYQADGGLSHPAHNVR